MNVSYLLASHTEKVSLIIIKMQDILKYLVAIMNDTQYNNVHIIVDLK